MNVTGQNSIQVTVHFSTSVDSHFSLSICELGLHVEDKEN